jgi:hypothetical protein
MTTPPAEGWTILEIVFCVHKRLLGRLDKLSPYAAPTSHYCRGRHYFNDLAEDLLSIPTNLFWRLLFYLAELRGRSINGWSMSALPPKADIDRQLFDVR